MDAMRRHSPRLDKQTHTTLISGTISLSFYLQFTNPSSDMWYNCGVSRRQEGTGNAMKTLRHIGCATGDPWSVQESGSEWGHHWLKEFI